MSGLFSRILTRFKKGQIDWDDVEEVLISGDLGVQLTTRIIDDLQDRDGSFNAEEVITACRKEILDILPAKTAPIEPLDGAPRVILVVGVNGTGKTTSSAKLAHFLKAKGHTVRLAAADTFRAAAIEQLEVWAQRLELPITKGVYKADPASVCFEAYQAAAKEKADFLICDTAGRLHTRHNLMQELGKIERVLGRLDPEAPHEVLIVVDATTGSNALSQAKEFKSALQSLTGVIVTKLDGSGKGGIVVAIQDQLNVPTRFIGTGERVEDFKPFQRDQFVDTLL